MIHIPNNALPITKAIALQHGNLTATRREVFINSKLQSTSKLLHEVIVLTKPNLHESRHDHQAIHIPNTALLLTKAIALQHGTLPSTRPEVLNAAIY